MPVEINIIGKKTCGVASLLAVLTASPTYPQLLAALVSENLQEKPSLSQRVCRKSHFLKIPTLAYFVIHYFPDLISLNSTFLNLTGSKSMFITSAFVTSCFISFVFHLH